MWEGAAPEGGAPAGRGRSALVTGAAGFAGRWLCGALVQEGWKVTGIALSASDVVSATGAGAGAPARDERPEVSWIAGDIRDPGVIARALDAAAPDVVFHLAGVSFVPSAEADPGLAYDVNVTASARLLAAVAARRSAGTLDPVILVTGSGEQYGRHDAADLPLVEDVPQRPMTVYAATKAAQEVAALQSCRKDGVRVIATRPFNHSGAGQDRNFLLPSLVRRALALRENGGTQLRIGNVEPVRDISHVRDVVRAYILLADRGVAGVPYNVSSGAGISVGELAQRVLARVGVDAEVTPDPALMRRADVPALVGSPARLVAATGWAPTHTFDDLIDDLIDAATH